MKEIPATDAYRALEPGPIVLVSTSDEGKPNVMTMGFHMVVQHEPPLIACVIGPWDHSYQALRKTGECVIAVPGRDLAEIVVDIGNCSGDRVDKFKKFGLQTRPAKDVSAPFSATASRTSNAGSSTRRSATSTTSSSSRRRGSGSTRAARSVGRCIIAATARSSPMAARLTCESAWSSGAIFPERRCQGVDRALSTQRGTAARSKPTGDAGALARAIPTSRIALW